MSIYTDSLHLLTDKMYVATLKNSLMDIATCVLELEGVKPRYDDQGHKNVIKQVGKYKLDVDLYVHPNEDHRNGKPFWFDHYTFEITINAKQIYTFELVERYNGSFSIYKEEFLALLNAKDFIDDFMSEAYKNKLYRSQNRKKVD